ncbi:MAG: phenylalanine--tRNA ligase subunit beta [Clostridia bacterium]|nr:phenylalanine--tRNA ligase subunit beta [Clostridia bacterium]MDD4386678.1 phenylalanine--tRNA ligase subunit beta [Clostridia bacterium]
MNVSLNWIKEYVKLDDNLEIKEITERLTMSGSKVEKFEKYGTLVEGVYTGLVENIVKHSEDDSFSIVTLNLCDNNYIAVAKIPDIAIGDIVPVALPNAKILGKSVKEDLVKGITSQCMICHIADLGLTKEQFPIVKSSGLISFPKDVKIGVDVSKLLGLGDYIIEFEITPNRSDCLSIEGLAREFAVTFDLECTELWQDKSANLNYVNSIDNISVKVETENCEKYILNVAKNIKIKPSPFEIQLKLMKSGYSVINNIVDITNFVMLEIGQPLHAFDRDILNGEIKVRQAYENEKIVTLDKEERILNNNNMVIADSEKAVAIAGVMGGLDSAISNQTTSVAIESANFIRGSIRNTSKKLLLRTDASAKYEKGLAPELTEHAMNRVCNLINTLGIGTISLDVVNVSNCKQIDFKLNVDYNKINSIVGTDLSISEIDNILNKLNLKVEGSVVTVPYYREDIRIIEDLSEEIARIYGYDKLPSTMPNTAATFGGRTDKQLFEDKIKSLSLSLGFNEIYTYTFFSIDTLKKAISENDKKLYNLVKLENPLSKDFEFMRTTTIPHMLEALERNYSRKNDDVKLFDLGKVFLNAENIIKNELCDEKLHLTLGMYGDNLDFYELKDVVSNILNSFKIETEIVRSGETYLHPGMSADLLVNNETIATIGKLNPKIIQNYTLPENTYIAIIYVDKVYENKVNKIKYKELPKYPTVERDIAFVINEDVLSGDIVKEIKNLNINIVENVTLFDVYQGNQIEMGKKSMAYRIKLRSNDKTLEDTEISAFMDSLFDMLNSKFKAQIRK